MGGVGPLLGLFCVLLGLQESCLGVSISGSPTAKYPVNATVILPDVPKVWKEVKHEFKIGIHLGQRHFSG